MKYYVKRSFIDGYIKPIYVPSIWSTCNNKMFKSYQICTTKNGKRFKEYDNNKWV